jgi:cell division protein FtsZ
MSFELIDTREQQADIKVVGVGGCGNNAIEYMIKNKVSGVDFICVNTDAQDLKNNPVSDNRKCNIGNNITRGLGAGANPDIGRQAAIEDRDKLKECIENCDMLFLTAGMGGGTGTGASPIIAELAREMGILTVAVVTKPWKYEKKKRMKNAEIGIEELRNKVDSLIVIPNDKLCSDKDMPLSEAKNQSNAVLERAVGGIAELITKPGDINLDFADVRQVMLNAGSTMMGTGIGEGQDRAEDAIREAIASPILEDVNVEDAKGLLINITSNGSLTNGEFEAIGEHIESLVDEEVADVIIGTTIDESLEGKLKVTLVATGMNNTEKNDSYENEAVDIKSVVKSDEETVEVNIKNEETDITKVEIQEGESTIETKKEEEILDQDTIPVYIPLDGRREEEMKNNMQIEEVKDDQQKQKTAKQNNLDLLEDLPLLDIPTWLRKQMD